MIFKKIRSFLSSASSEKIGAANQAAARLLAMREPNHPLFIPEQNVAVLWSAKGGCTFAAKWVFYQLGLLDEALKYSSWIHHYRVRVYCHSEHYAQSVRDASVGKYRYVKVVRNPFVRAVSSYLHLIKTPGAKDFHAPVDQYFGRDIDEGLSFEEFVGFLENIDIHACDIHYQAQVHRLELDGLIAIDRVVKLDDGLDEFIAMEQSFGFEPAPLGELRTSHHNTGRNSSTDFVGRKRLKQNSVSDEYPEYQVFYDADLQRRVAAIYSEDFKRYDYSTKDLG